MTTITVPLEKFPEAFKRSERSRFNRMQHAAYRAALRGLKVVVKATPADRGLARQAWTVERTSDGGARLENDAPYIAVLEFGSRPHRPPLMPILRWVVRKFGLNLDGGARSFTSIRDVPYTTYLVARAICDRIEREGTRPYGMVSDNLTTLGRQFSDEIRRAVERASREASK